jgi:hypothetical protein
MLNGSCSKLLPKEKRWECSLVVKLVCIASY